MLVVFMSCSDLSFEINVELLPITFHVNDVLNGFMVHGVKHNLKHILKEHFEFTEALVY